MSRSPRVAVSKTVIAVVLIIVVAAGGAGYYFVTLPVSSSTHSSSSSTASTSTSEPISSSGSSTTSRSAQASNLSGVASLLPATAYTFFQVYSESTWSINNGNNTDVMTVVGHPTVTGVATTEVTSTIPAQGSSPSLTVTVWYGQDGNPMIVEQNGFNYTGSDASAQLGEGAPYYMPFSMLSRETISLISPVFEYNGSSSVENLGTTTQTFGSTSLQMTTYALTSPVHYDDSTVSKLVVVVGYDAAHNLTFIISFSIEGTRSSHGLPGYPPNVPFSHSFGLTSLQLQSET